MRRVCSLAGLDDNCILADDAPPPRGFRVAFAVATDDTIVFTRRDYYAPESLLHRLDRSFIRCNVAKHAAKDVTLAADVTCIGIDVCGGRFLAPHADSLAKVLAAVCHMVTMGGDLLISPRQMAALLGVMQWHCQLNRPVFSAFFPGI